MDVERFVENFDHHSPALGEDPYGVYAALRARPPVYTEAKGGFWVVSRYRDIVRVATDDASFVSSQGITIPRSTFRSIPIDIDPPEFFNYRRFLNPFFSPAALKRHEIYTREVVHRLIDGFIEKGHAELVEDFAKPLPAMVTVRLVGLGEDQWRRYSDAMAPHTNAPREEIERSFVAALSHVESELDERGRCPAGDFLSALVHSDLPDGRRLTAEEQRDIVSLVFAGGLETTTAAIGNALEYLDGHPETRQMLTERPSLMPTAIEEFLRYDAPVVGLARTVGRDVEFEGQKLREGQKVLMLWASGNRDPEEFARPDEVVLDRHPNRHLAFGVGNHRCLGSNLARVEFRIALEALLERVPDLRIGHRARRQDVGTVYGHTSLEVDFTPGRRVGS